MEIQPEVVSLTRASYECRYPYQKTREKALRGELAVVWVAEKMFISRPSLDAYLARQALGTLPGQRHPLAMHTAAVQSPRAGDAA